MDRTEHTRRPLDDNSSPCTGAIVEADGEGVEADLELWGGLCALDETPGLVAETMADVSGACVAGDRVYGDYDDRYGGRDLDLRTGEVAPGDWGHDSDPLEALLA